MYLIYKIAEWSGAVAGLKTLFKAGIAMAWAFDAFLRTGYKSQMKFAPFVEDVNDVMGWNLKATDYLLRLFVFSFMAGVVPLFWDDSKNALPGDAEEETTKNSLG